MLHSNDRFDLLPLSVYRSFIFLLSVLSAVGYVACHPKSGSQGLSQLPQSEIVQAMPDQPQDYAADWKIVDSLEKAGLYKSALEQVDRISLQAQRDRNDPQRIKALLFRGKYSTMLEEDGFVLAVRGFEEEVQRADEPGKSVLHSLLGELYATYLANQGWKLRERTPIPDGEGGDILTWSADQIEMKSLEHYRQSVQAPDRLRATPVEQFRAITTAGEGDTATAALRPTLYDLLAHRALQHYANERSYLTEPAYKFYLDRAEAFSAAAEFVQTDFFTRDTQSGKWLALQLFRGILASHLNAADPSALIDADLLRLQFVYGNAVLEQKDSLYEAALLRLHAAYRDHPSDAEIVAQLAGLYLQQSGLQPERRRQALELCEDAIRRHPRAFGAGICATLVQDIRRSTLQVEAERVWLPGKPVLIHLSYQNLAAASIRVVRGPNDPQAWNAVPWDDRLNDLLRRPALQEQQVSLPDPGDYGAHRTECALRALPAGQYFVLVSTTPDFDPKKGTVVYIDFTVSGLAAFQQTEKGKPTLWTVDRAGGAPVQGVRADLFQAEWNQRKGRQEYNLKQTLLSDALGRVRPELNEYAGRSVRLSKDGDTLWLDRYLSAYRYREPGTRTEVQFFTDRSLYRPGQMIYFKGILLERDVRGVPRIKPDTPVKVWFYDANGQPKDSRELRSNAYGTFNGVFTAPASGLTGAMRIGLGDNWSGSAYVQVEEYKRPRFEVTFLPQTGAYRLNDTVRVSGEAKNYAGSVVDGATVRYRVVRRARFPYWDGWGGWRKLPWNTEEMEIANGTLETDAKGQFEIPFAALPDRTIPERDQPVFDYTIYADITDISGETRSGEQQISVGYVALQADVHIGAEVHVDSLRRVMVSTTNLAGVFQSVAVSLSLQRLVHPGRVFKERYWERPDQWMLSETDFRRDFPDYAWKDEDDPYRWDREDNAMVVSFNSDEKQGVDLHAGRIRPGYYLLELQTQDAFGKMVRLLRILTVWDDGNRSVRYTSPGVRVDRPSLQPGETAQVWLGSPAAGVHFLVAQERNGVLEEPRWFRLKDPVQGVDFSIRESDRGGVSVHHVCVWNNRIYQLRPSFLAVPWSNKELDIRFETFRDKLAPGEQEEWRLKISGPAGEKVAAEMVAALYDASLDQFLPHQWNAVRFPMHQPRVHWMDDGLFGAQWGTVLQEYEDSGPAVRFRRYADLNWFNFPLYGRARFEGLYRAAAGRNGLKDEAGVVMEMAPAPPAAQGAPGMEKMAAADTVASPEESEPSADAAAPQPAPPSPIRTNLNETVFFFPEMRTDAEGNLVLKFKMNEALTRWKLLTFAHTPALQNALATREVVTQKELMVIANPPRFLRAGDEIVFAAKLSNMSADSLSGTASLALLDAATLQPLEQQFGMSVQDRQVQFTVPAGQSAPLQWRLKVPADFTGAVTWQVFADGRTARDGEESTLPVVTNRILVTETLPITVRGGQTRNFRFEQMAQASASRTPHRYTLEFTSNPAWYVVQALPYLMEYPHECSEQIFSRLYANTLAQSVTRKLPAIRRMYERWKGTDALKSNLAKNQELRSALLEETPWVFEAADEANQKQQIALLFDLNRMADEQEKAVASLADRQSAQGGWSWFPGGPDSWYITQYILAGFGHLDRLGALTPQDDPRIARMIERATDYCDREADRRYRELERLVQKGQAKWEDDHLDGMIIQYLYAKSFFNPNADDKVTAYYLGQAEKYWLGKGLYQEGMLALVLHRANRKATAGGIVNSLRERAVVKEELGMYWVFDWGYYWYQLPVETQALMVEVFDEVAADKTAVENLRIWLLKNKQTNRWESTKATAEAVYAMLLHGDNWLENARPVQIALGGKTLQPKETEPGTGYFKEQWSGREITAKMADVRVENPNSNLVWGAAYWQYFEDLDRVKSFRATPLTVVRKLYREENSPTGPQLVPVDAGAVLRVGDKIKVRIEIRVDRPMEYVHLKDMRAAGFEPVHVLSGYRWQGGLGYYESTRDLATHFFIDYLPRGTFVLEYPLVVSHKGDMSNGISTLQCMYAPEFSSHAEGVRVKVE